MKWDYDRLRRPWRWRGTPNQTKRDNVRCHHTQMAQSTFHKGKILGKNRLSEQREGRPAVGLREIVKCTLVQEQEASAPDVKYLYNISHLIFTHHLVLYAIDVKALSTTSTPGQQPRTQ